MESLKIFTDKIKKYYNSVEIHDKVIQDCIKETEIPIHSIINQSAILRAVIPENSFENTGFEEFPGYKEALLDQILESLEKELVILIDTRNKIDEANEVLFKEYKSIEGLFSSLRRKKFTQALNPCSPPLEIIINWCRDTWCFYHSLYLQFSSAIYNLQFENENTVNDLYFSVKESSELKVHINKIRSLDFANFEFIIEQ